jgi:hypothetical protein
MSVPWYNKKITLRSLTMVRNIGPVDRILRVLAAVLVGVLLLTGVLKGTVGLILGILAVVFLLTATVGFCPLYVPLKITTKQTKKRA